MVQPMVMAMSGLRTTRTILIPKPKLRKVKLMPSFFYAIPLAAVVSLVYTTSRYELPSRFVPSAAVMFVKTIIGLGLLYGVLWYFSS